MAGEIILAHIYQITLSINFRGEKANREFTSAKREYINEPDIRKEALLNWIKDAENSIERSPYYKKLNAKVTDFKFKGINVKYKGTDRWWLRWFSHETFCKFDTEREMFDDFEDFLREKGVHLSYGDGDYGYSNYSSDKYCAMGAEDVWRWKQCACDNCIKFGNTIINH